MVVSFTRLSHSDIHFQNYERKFKEGWQHGEKDAKVKEIYLADTDDLINSRRGTRFRRYMDESGGTFRTLFHGTQRACKVGDHGKDLKLCYDNDCYLCKVLWTSFKVKYADDESMFGAGIYTTPISSKADRYAKNHYVRSRLHAMLICRVVCNEPQYLHYAENKRTSPDSGYNCVEAVTTRHGGSVEYPEIVVYRDDAIVPIGVIMYTREGWQA